MLQKQFKYIVPMLATVALMGCSTTPVKAYRSTVAGNEVLLGEYGFWYGSCETEYFYLKIESKPAHGTTLIRESDMKIPSVATIGTSDGCAGRPVKSKQLFFVPDSEFKGIDKVVYSIQTPRLAGWERYSVEIMVR